MPTGPNQSRLTLTIDLARPGRQVGDLVLRWSDNRNPLGHYPLPVFCIARGSGPTVLMIGGVHGDEFEGPAALMRLAQDLREEDVTGRVILMPALNHPALNASSRVSPLDGQNLNRAFPGDRDGGPTAMIAHFIETVLIPQCDAVIDLHSGGKASVFQACALATRTEDPDLFAKNMALARAFGLSTIWVLGAFNDDRSVNSAAARAGVPMIASELGGGGGADPVLIDQAEAGLRRCLAHLGVMSEAPDVPEDAATQIVEITDAAHSLHAPAQGLFDRKVSAGQSVTAGQQAGVLHFIDEPQRASLPVTFPADGFVLAHTNRGVVERGEMLAMVATPIGDGPA